MRERYRHPPLVELIAELRWGSAIPASQPQGPILLVTSSHEEFFMRFGSKAGALGYERVERLIPAGFPAMPFQAIYRFRKKGPEEGTTLYQVGAGMFSANITPPYDSWERFEPVVREGVRILLESRNPSEREMPFTSASLRYIDAFGSKFTEGRSMATFVREVLGFVIELPAAVLNEMTTNAEPKPSLQLLVPLKSGQQMSVVLAEGLVSGEQAVVMDLTVSTESQIPATSVDSAMAVFETAHEVLHRVFVGTTKKLSDVMELIEGDKT
jgi:uncharacterized protein (TIGR04255 family)